MKCYYQIKVAGEKNLSPVRFRMADSLEEGIDRFKTDARSINRALGYYNPDIQPELLVWKGKPSNKYPCKTKPDAIFKLGPRGGVKRAA